MTLSRRSLLKSLGVMAILPWMLPHLARAAPAMRIGVIGAGSLGGTVGRLWVKAGHEVMFSSRHPEELESMARELGPRASVGQPAQAAEFGTVLLLAVPFEALPQVGRDLRSSYSGKVVLDATNPPLSGGSSPLILEARANGVAQTVAKYMPGARLVRAFSCVDANVVESFETRAGGRMIGMPIASDDAQAMQVAAGLVRDAGCDPVVVGNLAAAVAFQQGGLGWRAHLTAPDLRRRLGLPAAGRVSGL
ncbi:NADPH-dependent F420 reductase [Azotobacter armeniacus]